MGKKGRGRGEKRERGGKGRRGREGRRGKERGERIGEWDREGEGKRGTGMGRGKEREGREKGGGENEFRNCGESDGRKHILGRKTVVELR